ncbi:hypothetical protein Ga0074812_101147 [Parafrankia irregularis]|uniref:Uncharacterized protein n=1 Tax=Parafrankia irregularis TaxID=795642 RepID=A0A0S4QDW7_9ACTN|nr:MULTISPECIES: hypothetical protein [Parafrankia]MBE3199682.1 hypothetical protein [Parafrankia sp. CH37]CUU53649.1 hypothetical protein Ga0074812_101147 [Parafrankia irregularis]
MPVQGVRLADGAVLWVAQTSPVFAAQTTAGGFAYGVEADGVSTVAIELATGQRHGLGIRAPVLAAGGGLALAGGGEDQWIG